LVPYTTCGQYEPGGVDHARPIETRRVVDTFWIEAKCLAKGHQGQDRLAIQGVCNGDLLWKDHKVVIDDAIDKLLHS
jgi:hypothetical protein